MLCLATGSQGEPMSALSRIAIDDHRHVKLGPDDTVVLSARAIPGNEKAIGRVINHIARRGADVIHEGIKHVHVSGHGSEEELKLMLSLVRPRYFVPVHGEYRQLSQHARVAERVFAGREPKPEILLAENGDVIQLRRRGRAGSPARRRSGACSSTARAPARSATRCCAIGATSPRTAWSCRSSPSTSRPARSRACPTSSRAGSSWRTARRCSPTARALLSEVIEQASVEERTDQGLIKEKLRVELRRFFRKRSGRRPFVLPVIMEI